MKYTQNAEPMRDTTHSCRLPGKTRVRLELVMSDGGWHIASETGEAMQ